MIIKPEYYLVLGIILGAIITLELIYLSESKYAAGFAEGIVYCK